MTERAKHTPGPWTYRPLTHDDWGTVRSLTNSAIVAVARAGGLGIDEEELDRHRRQKTDPYEANGRLIAAAPEMLDALWGALVVLDILPVPSEVSSQLKAAVAKRHEAVRLAIAKAT
jgi:hypothetical protein